MLSYEEIGKAMKESGYSYFGVRVGNPKKVGQYCAVSHDWTDGEYHSKRLSGTCATDIGYVDYDDPEDVKEAIDKAVKINNEWSNPGSGMTYIVGGDSKEYGNDYGEVIINTNTFSRRRGARVIAILES